MRELFLVSSDSTESSLVLRTEGGEEFFLAVTEELRELLVEALLRLEERIPGLPVMPVHDELVTFSPEPLAPLVRATLAECMSFSLPMPDGTHVPIVAEPADPAPRWWSST